jgi:ABC-type transport system involved in cytochrome bd biosynthesis fused ATPase/permease subunit
VRPLHLAFLGLVAVGIKGVSGTFASFAQATIAADAAQALRGLLVENLFAYGLETSSPHAIALISSRVREAERAIGDGCFAGLRALAQLVPIACALFIVSPQMSLFALLALSPFAFVLSRARKAWRNLHQDSMKRADRLQVEIDDLVRHADLWRSHGSSTRVSALIHTLALSSSQSSTKAEAIRVALSSSNELLGALALLLAIFAAEKFTGYSAAAQLIAFSAIFFMAYRPVRDLGDARAAIVRGQEAIQSLQQLSRVTVTLNESAQLAETSTSGQLRAHRLCVPGRSPSVSFTLQSGQVLALCGPSGCGKTSLLRAILGLETTATGQLSFNDRQLEAGAVGPKHRPFAWLPQDAPVISGTLEDNFALVGATQVLARKELEKLGASSLLAVLEQTQLGAAGRTLSGGERRWLGLARVLATGCPVLLLDEPTEGLDPQARQRVMSILRSIRGHRTVIVVSHHQDLLGLADQVIRLDYCGVERESQALAL